MATLSAIEGAVLAILAGLSKASGGSFTHVGRWAGEVRSLPGGGVSLDREIGARSPALLLQVQAEAATDAQQTLAGDAETVGKLSLAVYVVVRDPRGSDKAIAGAGPELGLVALVDLVTAALATTPVTSGTPALSLLYRNERLHYRGFAVSAPPADANLCLVATLRFEAERTVDAVTATEPTAVTLGELVGSEHLKDGPDAVPANGDPIVQFQSP